MKNKSSILSKILMVSILLLSVTGSMAQDEPPTPPEKIIIGNPIALSGQNAQGAMLTQVPSYDLWVEDVNADGGIYVEEYDTNIPVEILRYDDTSDIGTSVQLLERLILEDQVNFIFPPWGTAFNFAIAPLVTQYETPVIGCTVGSQQLQEEADQFPYYFVLLNQPTTQGPGIVDLLVELGVETVAVSRAFDDGTASRRPRTPSRRRAAKLRPRAA